MNFKRREFIRIVSQAIEGKIETLVVAHKDRLCRFAFELIEILVEKSGCQIIVANLESCAPQQELVEDLLAIVHSFSCRIYGRSYANQKTKAFSEKLDIPRQRMLTLRKDVQA